MKPEEQAALQSAVMAMAQFKRMFRMDLSPSLLAEIYVALELDLDLPKGGNQPGFDLTSTAGLRYQVKQRNSGTQNVDVNNFDFDFVVLVNLGEDCQPTGMWILDVGSAMGIFVDRVDYRKHQVSQSVFKRNAKAVPLVKIPSVLAAAAKTASRLT